MAQVQTYNYKYKPGSATELMIRSVSTCLRETYTNNDERSPPKHNEGSLLVLFAYAGKIAKEGLV
jgi:hypothetical protein